VPIQLGDGGAPSGYRADAGGDECGKAVHVEPGMAVRDSDGFGGGSDSAGFGRIPSSPAGDVLAVLYSLYGHFDPTEIGSGFGRIRSWVGFGRIPGPQI
jgi:hypothetical protein